MTREEDSRTLKLIWEQLSFRSLFAKERRHYMLFRIILLVSAFLLITGNWYLFERKTNYRTGYPSPKTYFAISSAVYEDREATKELRERAASRIVDVVAKDEKKASTVTRNLTAFKTGSYSGILSEELAELFKSLPAASRRSITKEVLRLGREIGSRAEDADEQSAMIWHELKSVQLSQADKNVIYQILNSLLSPYVLHDSEMTERLKSDIASHIPAVVRNIQPGAVLVQKGQIVTKQNASILRAQGYSSASFPIHQIIFVLLIIAVWSIWPVWIENGLRQRLTQSEWMYTAAVLVLTWLLETVFARLNGGYAMAVLGLTGWLCLTLPVSLSYHLILGGGTISVLIAFNNNQTLVALGFLLALFSAGIGRIMFIDYPGRRGSIWKRLFLLGILLGIITLFVNWGAGMPLNYKQTVNLFMFSAVWSTLVIALLPIWETVFDVISSLRLLELCDQSQPLLKRLQLEAPGTYHHTLMTGNLALAAADKLKLNGALIRAGAYYHDIGKLKNPRYFIENQLNGENLHDNLQPVLSAQIIISHVREGLEIASASRLPKSLCRFIAEHHGTTVMKYFYNKAAALGEDVILPQFTYPGPKPQSMETALVMLADSVEAALKARNKPFETEEEIRSIVESVVRSKIDEGQLDNAEFTLREMQIIKDTFTSVLVSIYHSREVSEIEDIVQKIKDEKGSAADED